MYLKVKELVVVQGICRSELVLDLLEPAPFTPHRLGAGHSE